MRLILLILTIVFYASFLHAEETSFKLSFGTTVGNIPLQITKTNKNTKNIGGIKLNSWILSPNFSPLKKNKELSSFSTTNYFEEMVYIKFKLKF